MDTPQEQRPFNLRLTDGRQFGPATLDLIAQWAREGRVPTDAMLVPADGASPPRPVLDEPALAAVLQAPPTVHTGLQPAPQASDGLSVMIPYRNPHALIGYYVSIGSLLPILGLLAGPTAIVLGIIGIRKRMRNPQLHGLAHAWIAIALGIVGTLISIGCVTTIIVSRSNL